VNDGFDGRIYFDDYPCYSEDSLIRIIKKSNNYNSKTKKFESNIEGRNYLYNFHIIGSNPCYCDVFILYYSNQGGNDFDLITDMSEATQIHSRVKTNIKNQIFSDVANTSPLEDCDSNSFIFP
jgi:hypothetical protein